MVIAQVAITLVLVGLVLTVQLVHYPLFAKAILAESLAIMEYLEELHPEPAMIGRTPVERAKTRRIERICELGDDQLGARPFVAGDRPTIAG